MSRTFFVLLSLATLLTLALLAVRPAHAQDPDVCYAVADHSAPTGSADALVTLNRMTGVTTLVGFPGTDNIEAIAFEPGGNPLYAANAGQLGTLNLGNGLFTPASAEFGTAGGAMGEIDLNDVDGLTVDTLTGIFYGTQRERRPDMDLLFQINKATGAHVPNAFGPGVDYVVISGPGVMNDVDDLAVDPVTGQMFGASNDGGDGGVLISIDKNTGSATVVGEFGVDDIEGLAYFNDGRLYGSTGADTTGPDTVNRLYIIDETTGVATLVAPFSQFTDYEALDCLTGPTSVGLASFAASAMPPVAAALAGAGFAGLMTLTLLMLRRRLTA